MSKEMGRREFLKILGLGIGAASAAAIGINVTRHGGSYQKAEHPDEVFFQVADTFGIDYKDPDVAKYMQPPKVETGTGGCPRGYSGCEIPSKNIVYVGNGNIALVAHEMGHSVFDKYRMYSERDTIGQYALETDSYPGYPKVLVNNPITYRAPKPNFHEYIGFCAEYLVGNSMPQHPDQADRLHKPGAYMFVYTRDKFGTDGAKKISGSVVRSIDPQHNLEFYGTDPEIYHSSYGDGADLQLYGIKGGIRVIDLIATDLGYMP